MLSKSRESTSIEPNEVINAGTRDVNTNAGELKIPRKIIIREILRKIL